MNLTFLRSAGFRYLLDIRCVNESVRLAMEGTNGTYFVLTDDTKIVNIYIIDMWVH